MACIGICQRYKYKKKDSHSKQFYLDGASRCQAFCFIWLQWEGLFCPCCGMKLRKKPRNKNGKAVREKIDSKRSGTKKKTEPIIKVTR